VTLLLQHGVKSIEKDEANFQPAATAALRAALLGPLQDIAA